jgi:hypothetical protein
VHQQWTRPQCGPPSYCKLLGWSSRTVHSLPQNLQARHRHTAACFVVVSKCVRHVGDPPRASHR